MMLDLCNLTARREDFAQVIFPTSGIFAVTITAHRRPIEDGLNATTHAVSCFWNSLPDRLKALQHKPNVDFRNRQFAENGKCVSAQ